MEKEIAQTLQDVGYSGPLLEPVKLSAALNGGPKSPAYTLLVSWLVDQIGSFGQYDETVQATSSPEDSSHFLLEISMFLKELGCVNKRLTAGNVNQRLSNVHDRAALIEYLAVELMTSKIIEAKKPENKKNEITISESITAKNMREMLGALQFQKPPDNITPEVLFQKLNSKVSEILQKTPKDLLSKPLFWGGLDKTQWDQLNNINSDLDKEYTIRREMLLKRLDVTVNSFTWSERIRPKESELNKCYDSRRQAMKREPDVSLAHLLASREDLAIMEKTSSASVRKNTRSSINKVIIGAVPDRGGRSWEQAPPPPEMPPWQKDKVPVPPGHRGGRGGGRGSGGNQGRGRGQGGGNYGGGNQGNPGNQRNQGNYGGQGSNYAGEASYSSRNPGQYQYTSGNRSGDHGGSNYSNNYNTGSRGDDYGRANQGYSGGASYSSRNSGESQYQYRDQGRGSYSRGYGRGQGDHQSRR